MESEHRQIEEREQRTLSDPERRAEVDGTALVGGSWKSILRKTEHGQRFLIKQLNYSEGYFIKKLLAAMVGSKLE